MKAILAIAQKDLRLLLRDRFGLFWVLVFPLIMAILFGNVFANEGSGSFHLDVLITDQDQGPIAREVVKRLRAIETLSIEECDLATAQRRVERGQRDALIRLGHGFSSVFASATENPLPFDIGVDPSRMACAAYLKGVMTQMRYEMVIQRWLAHSNLGELQRLAALSKLGNLEVVAIQHQGQLRPRQPFDITFPSGMLWGFIGCVMTFGLSLVVERRRGTLLRLRFAPITHAHILAGKGLACFITCQTVLAMLFVIAVFGFGVQVDSPLKATLAGTSASLCFVGLTILISVIGKTERATTGAGWAIMLTLAMFGGGMLPLAFMPNWMRAASHLSPVKWSILALEGAIWRHFDWLDMLWHCGLLVLGGIVFFTIGACLFVRRAT